MTAAATESQKPIEKNKTQITLTHTYTKTFLTSFIIIIVVVVCPLNS